MSRRSVVRAVVVLVSCVLISSVCTVHRNAHFQADFVPGPGYHVHVYRTPTMMIWFSYSFLCNWNPGCALDMVRNEVEVNGIFNTLSGLDAFFDAEDVGDFEEALRSTPHPWPLSVNLPEQYGCLGGYKNLLVPRADGDWYGDPPDKPWCPLGQPLR